MWFVPHQVLHILRLAEKWAVELNPGVLMILPHSLQLEYSQHPCRFEREIEREREYGNVRYPANCCCKVVIIKNLSNGGVMFRDSRLDQEINIKAEQI